MDGIAFKILLCLKKYAAIISIVFVNAIPLIGVIFFDWKFTDIFIIYWLESIIVAFFGFIKMYLAKDEERPPYNPYYELKKFEKKFIPMFIFGYIFSLWAVSDISPVFLTNLSYESDYGNFPAFISLFPENWTVVFVIIFISYSINFYQNFIGKKEFLTTTSGMQLAPMAWRQGIIITVILGGAYGEKVIGLSNVAVFLMVICKTALEAAVYYKKDIPVYK